MSVRGSKSALFISQHTSTPRIPKRKKRGISIKPDWGKFLETNKQKIIETKLLIEKKTLEFSANIKSVDIIKYSNDLNKLRESLKQLFKIEKKIINKINKESGTNP